MELELSKLKYRIVNSTVNYGIQGPTFHILDSPSLDEVNSVACVEIDF
jgi:hypothetical protein